MRQLKLSTCGRPGINGIIRSSGSKAFSACVVVKHVKTSTGGHTRIEG